MSQTSREQFEAWVKVRAVGTLAGFHQRLLKHCPLDENKYATSWVDAAWEGWQASRVSDTGRESSVSEMLRTPKTPLAEATAYALYDAGYRKVQP